MPANPAPFETLRQKLKLRHLGIKSSFAKNHPHIKLDLEQIRQHSAKLLTAGALGSTLLLPPGQEINVRPMPQAVVRSEEHTSELQSQFHLVCRLLLEK